MTPTITPEALERAVDTACMAYYDHGADIIVYPDRIRAAILAALPELQAAPAAAGVPEHLDVRRILLEVVPGEEGNGEEVYAKSVEDVEREFSRMSSCIAELEHAQPAAQPQAQNDRARETSRRQAAVAHMLDEGWRWDGAQWCREPQAEQQAKQQGAFANEREVFAEWHRRKGCSQQIIDDCLSGSISMPALAADLVQMALAARQPVGEPVALGAVDPIPCNWSEEDAVSLIALRDSLRRVIEGTTSKDAAHFLKQPGQRRMTIKDAQETAWAHLPYVDSLVSRAYGYTAPPAPAAAPAWPNGCRSDPSICIHTFGTDARVCMRCGWDFRKYGEAPSEQPAAPQGVDLGPLQRYTHSYEQGFQKFSFGDWVRFEDVRALIDSQHQQQENSNG